MNDVCSRQSSMKRVKPTRSSCTWRSRMTKKKISYEKCTLNDIETMLECAMDSEVVATGERLINYLNELCSRLKGISLDELSESNIFERICGRVMVYLLDEYPSVRAVTYRIIRLSSSTENDLRFMAHGYIDVLMTRSLELSADNEDEKIEAMKLCAHMFNIYKDSEFKKERCSPEERSRSGTENTTENVEILFPWSLIHSIYAIVQNKYCNNVDRSVQERSDGLTFSALALLVEVAVFDPDLVLDTVGTNWMIELLAGPGLVNRRISVLVGRVFTTWLDLPRLRTKAKLNTVLERIVAPFVEIGFTEVILPTDRLSGDAAKQHVDLLIDTCAQTYLNILRSWSGLFSCAASDVSDEALVSSPLKLLEYLGLGLLQNSAVHRLRDMVVEISCEFFDFPYSMKTFSSWLEAVHFYSKLHHPDSYKCSLRDDFILAEHEAVSACSPDFYNHVDLLLSFRALAAFFLISSGFITSLTRVILNDLDDPMSLKATLLVSDILRTGSMFLPHEWRLRMLSMSTLVQSALEVMSNVTGNAVLDKGVLAGHTNINETYTFPHAINSPLLLNRLDTLNKISMSRTLSTMPITNLELFVQDYRINKCRQQRLLTEEANILEENSSIDLAVQGLLSNWIGAEGRPRWAYVDRLLQLLEMNDLAAMSRHLHSDKCYIFFNQLMSYFSPSGLFMSQFNGDRFSIACGCRAVRLFSSRMLEAPQYEEPIYRFLIECSKELSAEKLYSGVFAPKSLATTSMYLFALIGSLSTNKAGLRFLERTQMFQTLVSS
ncbi:hypothetical protein AB6A40_000419 [Gnathostoma spinigerum]|uniref:Rapamycin-insensitive companion of mTOR N-terminal domain-containing protein n=1 Tax=Gnathostoma spinigerum TaxID=75299 RepID=A0ABD6EBP6_9BILA